MTTTKILGLFTALPEIPDVEIADSSTLQAIFQIYAALALERPLQRLSHYTMPERTTTSRPVDVARLVALPSAIRGNLPQIRRKEESREPLNN